MIEESSEELLHFNIDPEQRSQQEIPQWLAKQHASILEDLLDIEKKGYDRLTAEAMRHMVSDIILDNRDYVLRGKKAEDGSITDPVLYKGARGTYSEAENRKWDSKNNRYIYSGKRTSVKATPIVLSNHAQVDTLIAHMRMAKESRQSYNIELRSQILNQAPVEQAISIE